MTKRVTVAKTAKIPMTMRSSMRVKPVRDLGFLFLLKLLIGE